MKKLTLLLVAVACLCSGKANAQDGKGSVNFVPYVGVNYSDFSGDTDYYFPGTTGKVNLMGGASLEFQIADKSAIIADVNYRRLGAKTDFYSKLQDFKFGPIDAEYHYNKVTLDCISFGPQFKQTIVDGLSVRAGLECSLVLSARLHYHMKAIWGARKDDGPFMYSTEDPINYDDYIWHNEEDDDYELISESVSDNLKIAIPLGVSYDYKNFSLSATYHLPLTNCFGANGSRYHIRNQAFDLTIGYRLSASK